MASVARKAFRAELHDLTEFLGGQTEIAQALNVDRSSVHRWAGQGEPGPENQYKIAALNLIVSGLLIHFAPQTAQKWLEGLNAHLGNQKPIDLIQQGRIAEVIAAVEQARTGAYA
jgi:hypothetical protein